MGVEKSPGMRASEARTHARLKGEFLPGGVSGERTPGVGSRAWPEISRCFYVLVTSALRVRLPSTEGALAA
jgi:hypothetical protein